jgi:hypothetical protein
MHPDDLLKPDLLSEVLLLGTSVLIAVGILMMVVAVCTVPTMFS